MWYIIYILYIYTTQYIILYWHTLSSCHFPTFKCVNGTGAWTCFEDMGFFPRKEKTPPIFYPAKKSLQPKKHGRKGDVTISTQPPTKQPRYELVMRKFEDVLGPRSEALRFRCFHSLLTWPLTGGRSRVYEFWRFEVEESWRVKCNFEIGCIYMYIL